MNRNNIFSLLRFVQIRSRKNYFLQLAQDIVIFDIILKMLKHLFLLLCLSYLSCQ